MTRKKPVTESQRKAADELLARRKARASLVEFTRFTFRRYQVGWHHFEIAKWLEKLTHNAMPEGVDGLMQFAPPRHGKSELGAIRWPAWNLGIHPEEHFIATAYGDTLART